MAEKKFIGLQPLTSGSKLALIHYRHVIEKRAVHGYSLLRTQLNTEYFNDIFDETAKFDVPLEGHRTWFPLFWVKVSSDMSLYRY